MRKIIIYGSMGFREVSSWATKLGVGLDGIYALGMANLKEFYQDNKDPPNWKELFKVFSWIVLRSVNFKRYACWFIWYILYLACDIRDSTICPCVGLFASLPIGRSWVFPDRNLLTLVTKFGTSDK